MASWCVTGCQSKGQKAQGEDSTLMVGDTVADSTVYGVCGEGTAMHTVELITDAGDSTNIHPRNKVIPGERLAYWALSHDYDIDVPYMGPVYKSMTVRGGVAELSFDYSGSGSTPKGNPSKALS